MWRGGVCGGMVWRGGMCGVSDVHQQTRQPHLLLKQS